MIVYYLIVVGFMIVEFSALGAGGPRFESWCPDELKSSTYRNVGAFFFNFNSFEIAIYVFIIE